jgi:hypothetical protein
LQEKKLKIPYNECMDLDIRALERQFQQEGTISCLVALMRARVRGGFYQTPAALRQNNNLYRELLGRDLTKLMIVDKITQRDYTSHEGEIKVLNTIVPFAADINPNGQLSVVQILLPRNLTYDLICPPVPGRLVLMIYGLGALPGGGGAKEEMYAPGEVPFGSGLELCEHMLRTWRAKEASHGL